MLPLFTLLFFACLFAAAVERRCHLFAPACALQLVLVRLHPAAVIYQPLLALVGILYWRRFGWRPYLLGAALSMAVAAPYLYGESRLGFPCLGIHAGMLGKGSSFDFGALTALPSGLRLVGYSLPAVARAGESAKFVLLW